MDKYAEEMAQTTNMPTGVFYLGSNIRHLDREQTQQLAVFMHELAAKINPDIGQLLYPAKTNAYAAALETTAAQEKTYFSADQRASASLVSFLEASSALEDINIGGAGIPGTAAVPRAVYSPIVG